jgi:hypothetical protein
MSPDKIEILAESLIKMRDSEWREKAIELIDKISAADDLSKGQKDAVIFYVTELALSMTTDDSADGAEGG